MPLSTAMRPIRIRLLYYFGCLTRWPFLQLVFAPLELITRRLFTEEIFEGIRIVGMYPNPQHRSAFVARTREALALIKLHDPRRFRRIQREVAAIDDSCLTSPGRYRRLLRECSVNMRRLDFASNAELTLRRYCCLLIHESTHGRFYSRYIHYRGDWRERIERLCRKEEERFARRAFPDSWREIVEEFDPSKWHFSWHASRREKLIRNWRVFNAMLRDAYRRVPAKDSSSEE
jgi:hypothetical protein